MPSRSSGQRRAQGGGRTPNSEPRLQVFRDFNGLNFELSNHDGIDVNAVYTDSDQTDLQMNYVFLQNNVAVASNKTLETRDDIVRLFDAPEDQKFTGPVCLIENKLYAAKRYLDGYWPSTLLPDEHQVGVGELSDQITGVPVMDDDIQILDKGIQVDPPQHTGHEWTSLYYYDNQLIGLTRQNSMWTGDLTHPVDDPDVQLTNALEIPRPTEPPELVGMGTLVLSETETPECVYRIEVAYTYVSKFGPTEVSENKVFYANHPVSEWHAGCFLRLRGHVPSWMGARAVELYYTTDNAMQLILLGRTDVGDPEQSVSSWSYDWYGYVDATSMWPIANLIAPTENYTKGVPASKMCSIDGRMYFWGDNDNMQRLYIGGNPGNLLSISPGTGGGFVDIEPGTGQAVRNVCKYKTQSGNSIVTMLCDSPNSHKEQRFNLVENSISLSNEQSMKSWQAEQVAGAVGCKSYDGAVVCEDGLYSVSRYGLALTTLTMEYNSQIRTNYVSSQIKPVFVDDADLGRRLKNAMLLELDGIIYMALGDSSDGHGRLDNVIFCYDIDLKAWWTYTLDVTKPILNLFHVDWEGAREGIGIVTEDSIYMLPTTNGDSNWDDPPEHDFLIQTAELSTQMPQQSWQYLSQLEFHFDHIIGDVRITVRMIDMFGREIKAYKEISLDTMQNNYVEWMRIDQRVMSYVITMTGTASFRMTHFIARVYTMSNKISQVWGFDDCLSHRSSGSIHPTFKCYNDVRRAIFT